MIEVTYSDNTAIYRNSFGSGDLRITGPNGFAANASFASTDATRNSTPMCTRYALSAPGGTWDVGDNGTYIINMLPTGVLNTSGNYVPGGALGSFTVNINGGGGLDSVPSAPASSLPVAQLISAPTIKSPGGTVETLQVQYSDDLAIYRNSFGSGDLEITGPNGFATNANFVSTDATHDGTPMTATYTVNAPNGTWNAFDNGVYTVSMQKFGVLDTSGGYVPGGVIGSFTVAML